MPVMLGDARLASEFADEMLEKGIYVIGFSYPVVAKGVAFSWLLSQMFSFIIRFVVVIQFLLYIAMLLVVTCMKGMYEGDV